jgi:uncharacterized membrane protein
MSDTTVHGLSDRTAGAIAYITFLPAIVFLFLPPYNTSPYVRFHAWQSIFLSIATFVCDVIVGTILAFLVPHLPFGLFGLHLIWPAIDLVWLAIWILCVVKAVNGEVFRLPVIGSLAEQSANK